MFYLYVSLLFNHCDSRVEFSFQIFLCIFSLYLISLLLDTTAKVQMTKENLNKLDYIKIENVVLQLILSRRKKYTLQNKE